MDAIRSAIMPRPSGELHRRTSEQQLVGIIDIGSNSIRLVVYKGASRTPPVLFNEKVMAGLGRGVAANGRLSEESIASAVIALSRFALLAADMQVDILRTVATAAVREASNQAEFLRRVREICGLDVEVISGEAEARYAALGVIAGIPDADGIVGDLGGGSLELIRVADGAVHERTSLPIGSLKLDVARKKGTRSLNQLIKKTLDRVNWTGVGKSKPFYTVGGSWRALAQLHMYQTNYPLPVVHQYVMEAGVPGQLARTLAHMQPKTLKAVPNLSTSRIPSLPGAAVLLNAITKKLGSSQIVASANGLREGLLFAGLSADIQRLDPLIEACRLEGHHQGRFPEHGEALMSWMNGLFLPESDSDARLRLAACLLSDVAWRAHPDFRAERGLEVALHGNWVGVTARERAVLGAALFACFGGSPSHPLAEQLRALADVPSIDRARLWGLALRLGQRLTGGTAEPLHESRLHRVDKTLVLALKPRHAPLYGEPVARRLKALAQAMGLEPSFRVDG